VFPWPRLGVRRARCVLVVIARYLYHGLIALGEMVTAVPARPYRHLVTGGGTDGQPLAESPAPADRVTGLPAGGPPPGHPERLASHLSPSPEERLLWRELDITI